MSRLKQFASTVLVLQALACATASGFIGQDCQALPVGKMDEKQAPAQRAVRGEAQAKKSVLHADGEDVLKAAKRCLGRQMWREGFGLSDGRLGCAASLSNVLKLAGLKYTASPNTRVVRQKLLKGPLKTAEFVIKKGGDAPIDDATLKKIARPGDVLVAFMDPPPRDSVGPRAHCGIIGADGSVYTNDWNDGIWKNGNIHDYFDYYRFIRVIRLL